MSQICTSLNYLRKLNDASLQVNILHCCYELLILMNTKILGITPTCRIERWSLFVKYNFFNTPRSISGKQNVYTRKQYSKWSPLLSICLCPTWLNLFRVIHKLCHENTFGHLEILGDKYVPRLGSCNMTI